MNSSSKTNSVTKTSRKWKKITISLEFTVFVTKDTRKDLQEYQVAYLAFLTDKCPREPRFHDTEGVLICCEVIAIVILCVDQLRLQARE